MILEIQQEVSNVVQSETETSSEQTTPTINQRQISSTVAVQSGETVALGGLITDNRDRGSRGLPILSRIPIIGALFGTRSQQRAPHRAPGPADPLGDRQPGGSARGDRRAAPPDARRSTAEHRAPTGVP